MDIQSLLPYLNLLILVALPFVAQRYVEGWLKHHFDVHVESMRQAFQREITMLQSQVSYKQLSISKSFEETAKLNDLMWNAYWKHQDLWSADKLAEKDRLTALETLQEFRYYVFAHQIFFDPAIYENAIQLAVKMLSLSRYRATLAKPPTEEPGKDTEIEISNHLDVATRLIREKFEIPALPADLKVPPKDSSE